MTFERSKLFDWAREAAGLALHAYETDLHDEAFCWVSEDPKSETLVWVAFDRPRQMLLVACRGTVPSRWKNWVTNFRFWGKRAHPGIVEAAAVHTAFLWEIAERVPFSKLLVAGHSLGGAIATHIFEAFEEVYHVDQAHCVTFGAVRSRSREAAKAYDACYRSSTLRVVNNNDLVPRLLMLSRRHVGTPLYFDRNGRPHSRMVALGKLWDSGMGYLASVFLTPGKPDSLEDHEMRTYARLVRGM